MSSLTNVNVQSKTMNGLNTINADEITTENFTATNLNATDLTITGAINLPTESILDSYLSPNVAILNRLTTQTFDGNIDFNSNTFFRKNVEFLGTPSGQNLFQAYKNTSGNSGHILANGEGNLLYYDSTALANKWKLDTDGKLTIGNIDISGTLINKTTTAGDYIRSNSDATNYFYASNTGNIGFANSASNIGVNWYINANGNARFKSSTNSFKYWDINSNIFRYYNLGGVDSISMNGDTGTITTTGTISGTFNFGTTALRVGTTGSYSQKSIAIGTTSFGTAIQSVAIGDQALNASGSTANYSIAIGVNSLKLATGERNTAIGTDSLPLLTGTGNGANTAIGNLTGTKLTGGTTNLFLGLGSGAGITTGSNNLIVGSSMFASVSPDTGTGIDNNICVGSNAMGYIKDNCNANTAIGAYALYTELGYAGQQTVAIGGNSGVRSRGSYCTFIGNDASVDIPNSTYNFSTAIGYGAKISASNQVVIATSAQNTIIPGTLQVDSTVNCGNLACGTLDCTTIDATGDISTTGDVYATLLSADSAVEVVDVVDIQSTTGYLMFSGVNAGIRVGVSSTFLTDTTANNINIGNSSVALGGENVIIGYNAKGGTTGFGGSAKGQGTVLVGAECDSNGSYSTGVGHNATTYADSVAVGRNSNSGFAEGIAIGKTALGGDRSISIGSGSQSTGVQGISIGNICLANGQQAIGIGEGVVASHLQGVAIGAESSSTNTQVISIGYQAQGNQVNAIAIGALSQANGIESIAIGFEARANFTNAVSIGDAVQATAINEFRLGNASHNILVSQVFYPYEVSPTVISASTTITAPFYGVYRITATTSITITISGLSDAAAGAVLTFRKTASTVGMNIISGAGFSYFAFNGVSAITTSTAFIGTGQTVGRIAMLNATQFMVCT